MDHCQSLVYDGKAWPYTAIHIETRLMVTQVMILKTRTVTVEDCTVDAVNTNTDATVLAPNSSQCTIM